MTPVAELRKALGEDSVLAGDAIGARYTSDQSFTGRALPLAVVLPRTTNDVSAVLNICNAHGASVVAQGGMTGLAGGGNPAAKDIVISLERLRGIEEIDTVSATMTVRAGTPLAECQEAAAEKGLFLALDLGARGSCQIGGNLSTNAGGIRVIRYGMAREQVLGIEAVLADGTVMTSLNKMLKNNAGYDLKHLFVGSEGTLGIITRAVLRLHPPPGEIQTALVALSSYGDTVRLLRRAQAELGGILAFEAMWRDYFEFNSRAIGLSFFQGVHEFHVILESTQGGEAVETFLGQTLADGLARDALVARSGPQARDIWAVREGEPINTLPNLLNFDVSLPIAAIGDFASACGKALHERWPKSHNSFYGHVADSNVHICVSVEYGSGEDMHTVDDIVYGTLKGFGGSISAEHGVGALKRPYLHLSRSTEELALMRRLKSALDPKGILNPGKVI